MESLRLAIPRMHSSSSIDLFDVLCDYGTSKISESVALNNQPLPVWPEATGVNSHLFDTHLGMRHFDNVHPDGHLENCHLTDEHCLPAGIIDYLTPPVYFGLIEFAIRMRRGQHGPALTGKTISVVANSSPRPVFTIDSAALIDGAISLSFQASPDLS